MRNDDVDRLIICKCTVCALFGDAPACSCARLTGSPSSLAIRQRQSTDAFRASIHAPLRVVASLAALLPPPPFKTTGHCRAVALILCNGASQRSIYFLQSVILSAAKDPSSAQISIAAPESAHPSIVAPNAFVDRTVVFRIRKMMLKKRWRNQKRRVPHLPTRCFCAAKVGSNALHLSSPLSLPLLLSALAVAVAAWKYKSNRKSKCMDRRSALLPHICVEKRDADVGHPIVDGTVLKRTKAPPSGEASASGL